MINLLQDFLNWTGSSSPSGNQSGVQYGFWSGFGSDIAEFALIGSLIALYHHHNCAVPRCPRIAHKKYEVTEIKEYTCRKHHTNKWEKLLIAQYKQDYPEQYAHINKKGVK